MRILTSSIMRWFLFVCAATQAQDQLPQPILAPPRDLRAAANLTTSIQLLKVFVQDEQAHFILRNNGSSPITALLFSINNSTVVIEFLAPINDGVAPGATHEQVTGIPGPLSQDGVVIPGQKERFSLDAAAFESAPPEGDRAGIAAIAGIRAGRTAQLLRAMPLIERALGDPEVYSALDTLIAALTTLPESVADESGLHMFSAGLRDAKRSLLHEIQPLKGGRSVSPIDVRKQLSSIHSRHAGILNHLKQQDGIAKQGRS